MKKSKNIIILFVTLAISTISYASNQKTTMALSAAAGLLDMSPLDLPASVWNEADYYCSPVDNVTTPNFIQHDNSSFFYHEALVGLLKNAKKQKVNSVQKCLNAPKVNGVLMLYHPKDCPGYQEDDRMYEKPEREKYL
jgi:hypothetical protein